MEGLVGQYFYTIVRGGIGWHGQVVANPEPGWYLVQVDNLFDTALRPRRLMQLDKMADWVFHATEEDMLASGPLNRYGVPGRV